MASEAGLIAQTVIPAARKTKVAQTKATSKVTSQKMGADRRFNSPRGGTASCSEFMVFPQQAATKIAAQERMICISRCVFRTIRFASRMDIRDIFATNLRRLRQAAELSQDDLAYEAKVSRSYLNQIEQGTYYASLKIIERLAEALKVEPAALLEKPTRNRAR